MARITGMDNSTVFGRIGVKVFPISMANLLIMAILGVLFSEIFFSNVGANISSTFLLAKAEKKFDEKIYNS